MSTALPKKFIILKVMTLISILTKRVSPGSDSQWARLLQYRPMNILLWATIGIIARTADIGALCRVIILLGARWSSTGLSIFPEMPMAMTDLPILLALLFIARAGNAQAH